MLHSKKPEEGEVPAMPEIRRLSASKGSPQNGFSSFQAAHPSTSLPSRPFFSLRLVEDDWPELCLERLHSPASEARSLHFLEAFLGHPASVKAASGAPLCIFLNLNSKQASGRGSKSARKHNAYTDLAFFLKARRGPNVLEGSSYCLWSNLSQDATLSND